MYCEGTDVDPVLGTQVMVMVMVMAMEMVTMIAMVMALNMHHS